ncbi:MAG: hypothetical protein R2695_12020 [Acidimicrobiales bacterium]
MNFLPNGDLASGLLGEAEAFFIAAGAFFICVFFAAAFFAGVRAGAFLAVVERADVVALAREPVEAFFVAAFFTADFLPAVLAPADFAVDFFAAFLAAFFAVAILQAPSPREPSAGAPGSKR